VLPDAYRNRGKAQARRTLVPLQRIGGGERPESAKERDGAQEQLPRIGPRRAIPVDSPTVAGAFIASNISATKLNSSRPARCCVATRSAVAAKCTVSMMAMTVSARKISAVGTRRLKT
jgi:hypothetical protein